MAEIPAVSDKADVKPNITPVSSVGSPQSPRFPILLVVPFPNLFPALCLAQASSPGLRPVLSCNERPGRVAHRLDRVDLPLPQTQTSAGAAVAHVIASVIARRPSSPGLSSLFETQAGGFVSPLRRRQNGHEP